MTKQEQFLTRKIEALTAYLEMCNEIHEVPRKDLIVQINKCDTLEGLEDIIRIIKQK